MKKFTCVQDIGDLHAAVAEALEIKRNRFQYSGLGRNRTLLMRFFNSSLRTRLATQKAAMNLGRNVMVLDGNQGAWKLETERGVVMDGRDIGTVVFPDAELKIFMTADPAVRARRRYDELKAKGDAVSLEEIERNVRERDKADMSRAISPLRQAPDAVELDNSHMTVEEQMAWFMERFEGLKN